MCKAVNTEVYYVWELKKKKSEASKSDVDNRIEATLLITSATDVQSRPKVLSHEWTKVTIANYPTLN